jgi:hypothetical protein
MIYIESFPPRSSIEEGYHDSTCYGVIREICGMRILLIQAVRKKGCLQPVRGKIPPTSKAKLLLPCQVRERHDVQNNR